MLPRTVRSDCAVMSPYVVVSPFAVTVESSSEAEAWQVSVPLCGGDGMSSWLSQWGRAASGGGTRGGEGAGPSGGSGGCVQHCEVQSAIKSLPLYG